jgi:hypothetical protein
MGNGDILGFCIDIEFDNMDDRMSHSGFNCGMMGNENLSQPLSNAASSNGW